MSIDPLTAFRLALIHRWGWLARPAADRGLTPGWPAQPGRFRAVRARSCGCIRCMLIMAMAFWGRTRGECG